MTVKKGTFNQLINITVNSSLCEIRTYPKPGNIHKNSEFSATKYGDFLLAAYKMIYDWSFLFEELNEIVNKSKTDVDDGIVHEENYPYSSIYTTFLISSTTHMMSAQSGGNVLLGHLMLLTPLFITATYGLMKGFRNRQEFWEFNKKIIKNSTPLDTISLYKAIKIANPGGMGTIKRYDLYSKSAFDEIREDNINLNKIFELSSGYDSISHELAANYEFLRTEIIPKMGKLIDEYSVNIKDNKNCLNKPIKILSQRVIKKDIIEISPQFNEFILRLFLYILSIRPDTLITRKNNQEIAEQISETSGVLFYDFYKADRGIWYNEIHNFDEKLQKSRGKLNPGTTADLLAASIYIKLLYDFFSI
ncbi:MAG: triphosphoribosyl-dephospho-CoA synthase [Promethearchaeota archaeon]